MASRSPRWLSKLVKSPQPEPEPEPAEGDNDKSARRREQVRRAQRTHRDRKATYVKTLESEVAKLRARDSAHDAEIAAARDTIRRLKELIKQYNIPLPPDLASDPLASSPQATVELFALSDNAQSIRALFPEGYLLNPAHISTTSFPGPSGSTSSSDLLAGLTISDAPSLNQDLGFHSQPNIAMPTFHPQGLGATQVGVDFVLALEYVCLSHHAAYTDCEDGSGHQMMLLSPIMSRSPPLNPATQPGSGLPSGSTWTVPAVELEKLLEFSDRLSLDGEITPVEGWQRIRQHPKFSTLTRERLEVLKGALVPEVKCYGFGAVIDEDFFESLLRQALGPRPGEV